MMRMCKTELNVSARLGWLTPNIVGREDEGAEYVRL